MEYWGVGALALGLFINNEAAGRLSHLMVFMYDYVVEVVMVNMTSGNQTKEPTEREIYNSALNGNCLW